MIQRPMTFKLSNKIVSTFKKRWENKIVAHITTRTFCAVLGYRQLSNLLTIELRFN